MAVIPVSYIGIAVWLLFMLIQTDNYNLLLRTFGSFYGILTGVYMYGGEKWIYVSSTGTFSLVTFDDGLSTMLGTILIFGSVVMWYVAMVNYRNYRKANNIKGWRLG